MSNPFFAPFTTPEAKSTGQEESKMSQEEESAAGTAVSGTDAPKTPTMERGGGVGIGQSVPPEAETKEDVTTSDEAKQPALTGNAKSFYELRKRIETMDPDDPNTASVVDYVMNLEILNHIITHVLRAGTFPTPEDTANPENDLIRCLEDISLDSIHSLITMDEEDLKSIGVDATVAMAFARKLKALNYWYNRMWKQYGQSVDEYQLFMGLSSRDFNRFMSTEWRPTLKPPPMTSIPESEPPTQEGQEDEEVEEVPEPAHVSAGIHSRRATLESKRRESILSAPRQAKKSQPRVSFADTPSTRASTGPQVASQPMATSSPKVAPLPVATNQPRAIPRMPTNPYLSGRANTTSGGMPPNPTTQPSMPQPWIQQANYGLVQPPYTWPNPHTYGGTPTYSRAADFDKGGRRSVSDYSTFSNKEQWSKWNRQLVGQVLDHKCECVLNPNYAPDPNDSDEVSLFDSQQRFMFSVFTKTLTEPKAQDILRKYSNPRQPTFGDAQSVYADLVDHFEGGAVGRVSVNSLETKLTTIRLNKTWTKSVSSFVTHVSGLIQTHKDLTQGVHDDNYYIEKLNATFEEHKDMNSQIKTLETQENVLQRRLGHHVPPKTYDDQLHELTEYATTLDAMYSRRQNARRTTNRSERNDRQSGRGGGRGNGRQGNGRGGRGGRGNGGRGRGGRGRAGPGYMNEEEWQALGYEGQQRIIREREQARGTQQNNESSATRTNNQNAQSQRSSSTPPNQIQVQEQSRNQGQTNSGSNSGNQPGTMLRNMMSQSSQRSLNASQRGDDEITLDGSTYRRINITYRVTNKGTNPDQHGALVDGGANGGLLGDDVRIIEYVEGAHVDITGVGDAEVKGLKIAQAAAKVDTVADGPIIVIMSQYADLGYGKTIHSKGQMEHFGQIVDDTSIRAGGRQCIITTEGYTIPLHIRDGLPRMDMSIPTDDDLAKYPHVFITSDATWDPTILDDEYNESFYNRDDPQVQERREARDPRIDDQGFLRSQADYEVLFRAQDVFISENQRTHFQQDGEEFFFDAAEHSSAFLNDPGVRFPNEEELPETRFIHAVNRLAAMPNRLRRLFPHIDKLKPYFGWASAEKLKTMLDKTTQHYRGVIHYPFRKHYKSRFPAANVKRLNEWVATDTFFSDTPAKDDGIPGHGGCTMMQIFYGLTSGAVYGYPMKSEKQYPESLEDHIRKVGAPQGIFSDNAKAELYGRARDIQRMYCIDDAQSEPEYQHQNPAERKIQDVKRTMNNIMDRMGTPKGWWLLAAIFTLQLFLVIPNANGEIPNTVVTGRPTDISKFTHFHFWQEVFVESHKDGQKEELARWCFPADDVGDELTYWVLLNETEQLVPRSNVRPATDPLYPNLRKRPTETQDSRPSRPTVETVHDDATTNLNDTSGEEPAIYNMQDRYDVPLKLPRFAPEELLGLTYLHDTGDGQLVRATVTKKLLDRDAENHERIKMLVTYDDGRVEEVVAYNELCDIIADQHDAEASGDLEVYTFREILEYQGPLKPNDPKYMGSSYNVRVLWTDGSITWEPLAMMIKSDPVTLAEFAKEHDLLDKPGWKKLKKIARNAKVLQRMVNANKRAQRYNSIVYKFGVRIPRNVKEAYDLDERNGNTYWADAIKRELGQIIDYRVFRSLGKNATKPEGYQEIPIRIVFDVKQSLQRKARMVARGDKTNPPRDAVYSGVASMRSLRIVCFLAELNGLKLTGGDVGNAYLEAYTTEKVCFRAGKEFREFGLEGHMLVIEKALYGLRTSGARFHAKFADTLRQLGFKPSYADPDVWLRDAGDCYEYVVVYVDDILTALKDPEPFYKALQSPPWNYKLKNVEEPKYHLGGDFFRDKDGTLCYGAQTYVKRLVDTYKQLFGEQPTELHAPMDKADKPELDDSPLLGPDGIARFQSIIGACQWLITLNRFDIGQTVMSLGRFRSAPRVNHLERLKRLVGYLKKRAHGAIRFRTEIPQHEEEFGKDPVKYDWMESVYGTPPEEIDPRAPIPKGKMVRTTSFADANLMHDTVTGRSASGIIEFINQTPIDWFCKRQAQVECATYGSEFMVARQAVERIIDLRYTLRSFGVPLDGPAWLFGDNQSVVTSSTIPHSSLSKRWNALSYHKVREAVAGGWLRFEHIPGTENPADILTKPLAWYQMRVFVEPLLFWKGDTMDAPAGSSGSPNPEGSITAEQPVTSPSPGLPGPSRVTSDNFGQSPIVRGGNAGTRGVLWNNQYAALADEEDSG